MNHTFSIASIALGTLIGCGDNQKRTYLDSTTCDCDSIHSEYYKDGNVWSETPFINGHIHGIKKVYYMTGNTLRVVEYQNGVENGTMTDYTPTGELMRVVNIRNGEIIGVTDLGGR